MHPSTLITSISAALLLLLPAGATAQLNYTITTNLTITITGGPNSGAVTIPASINGLPVTSIGATAFWNHDNITSVSIPQGVTSIEEAAFMGCTSLLSIMIPNTVTNIGSQAFYQCLKMPSITVPNSVINIGQYAFYACVSLTKLTLSTNFTTIGNDAFRYCVKLPDITIPDSVTSIGASAFDNCTSLINIKIPNSVTNLGTNAFSGCTNLVKVTLPNTITSIGDWTFLGCTSLLSITIPSNISSIGNNAFWESVNLTEVFFIGPPPTLAGGVFVGADHLIVYYLPGTPGWGATFGGRPALPWNPQIQTGKSNFGVRANQFGFSVTGGYMVFVVEACTNLAEAVWSPQQTITLSGGSYDFSDPQWTNSPARFYRLRSP